MFKKLDHFLKSKTDEVVFIELKEGKTVSFKDAILDSKTPIPIPVADIANQAKNPEVGDFKLTSIIDGMVLIIGIDMEFKYKDVYIKFLKSIEENIWEKVIAKGVFLAEKGNKLDALLHFRAAYLISGDDINTLYNYARCLEELALESTEDEKNQEMFLDEAFDVFTYLLEVHPESAFAYYHLGFHYVNKKMFVTARSIWTKALKMELDDEKKSEIVSRLGDIDAKVNYEEGYNLILDGMIHEGLEKLLPLEDEYSDWWNLMFFIGLAYRQLENYDEALKYYQKVLALNTGHIDTFNEVALCYMSMENFESAKKYLDEALRMAPLNGELLCNLGIALLNMDELDEARNAIDKSLQFNPDDEVTQAWKRHMDNM